MSSAHELHGAGMSRAINAVSLALILRRVW